MNQTLRKRIEELFEQIVDLPSEEREVVLRETETELREGVERLLAADAEAAAADFLAEPARGAPLPAAVYRNARDAPPPTPGRIAEDTAEGVPEKLGPYPVEREIGRGGMGVVYLARDPTLERPLAIKRLHASLAEDPTHLERLRREARILASLNHPNVATLFGFEVLDERPSLLLEWVPGETLQERLRRGPLDPREALKFGAKIADALAAAHELGIIHRDLKPSNLRITPDGEIKVLDFGIAKSVVRDADRPAGSSSGDDPLTARGAILGTVNYMSPEQIEGRELDVRTDVWSFGCVIWECLSGSRTFSDATTWATLDHIVRKSPDWDALPETIPSALSRLLRRCLAKDRSERLRDLRDVHLEMLDLHALLSAEEPADPVPPRQIARQIPQQSARTPGSFFGPLRDRLRGTAFGALIGVLLGGLGVLAIFLGLPGFFSGTSSQPFAEFLKSTPKDSSVRRLDLDLSGMSTLRQGDQLPFFALSTDGEDLIYEGVDPEGRSHLFRRSLSSWKSELLPGTQNGSLPFFSPDGAWIGFFQRKTGARSDHASRILYKLALQSSSPLSLHDNALTGIGASWGENDRIVLAPTWQSGLWTLSANGDEARELTRPDAERGEVSHRWPSLIPGRDAVLYTVKTSHIQTFDEARIDVLDLRTGESKTLVDGGTAAIYLPTGHLLWARAEALHAAPMKIETLELTGPAVQVADDVLVNRLTGAAGYQVSRNGVLVHALPQQQPRNSVVRVDLQGNKETLLQAERFYHTFRLSPDGRSLLIRVIGANNSLWLYDLDRKTFHRLQLEGGNVESPSWSPDGTSIAFVAERDGLQEIVRVRSDGTGSPEVLVRGSGLAICDWSVHAGLLYLRFDPETGTDLWSLPPSALSSSDLSRVDTTQDAGSPVPILQTRESESCGRISPDGRYLALDSQDTGRWEIFLHPFPALVPRLQLSTEGAKSALWSADGKELYFSSNGQTIAIPVLPPDTSGKPRIGPQRVLFQTAHQITDFDGNNFLALADTPREAPPPRLRVVTGWFEEIKNQTSPGTRRKTNIP